MIEYVTSRAANMAVKWVLDVNKQPSAPLRCSLSPLFECGCGPATPIHRCQLASVRLHRPVTFTIGLDLI